MSEKETKTLAQGLVQNVENQGTFDSTDRSGNPQTNQKYRAWIQVPNVSQAMPLDVTLWNNPGAPCPLKPGQQVTDLKYQKVTITQDDGTTRYFYNYLPPRQSSGGGGGKGGGPRVAFRVSRAVNGDTYEAEWSGWADKADQGVSEVRGLLDKLINGNGSATASGFDDGQFDDNFADEPQEEEVPF